jgi:TctA family transporter
MDLSVFATAGEALVTLSDPYRLMMLGAGVVFGLVLGVVPGIGGLTGMALLLPFTFTMDSYAAFAMLLGMLAVSGTSDTITAILFGVPGSAGAQALVMDGYPMAKRGEAGRALSAAYTSSLIGGVFGAFILAMCIPILRPALLLIGSPEMLGFSVFGIAMVAVLSGGAPMRGLAAAGVGILLSMIGADLQTGTLRYTFGSFYLWDGLPIVPLVLGLFALPELADLAIKRRAINEGPKLDMRAGMAAGFMDAMRNWWLILRGGAVGAGIGALPGLGSSVVDWIAYGWAYQSVKDADKTFGKGDVRGVIAPESANNAITSGSLVPTIAFGVPGSATMAIMLSVFLIHGLVPGTDMLTTNLDVTFSMVWSIALANILGAGLCFLLSGQFAKIATLRYTLILPIIIVFIIVGAFQTTRNWGDLIALVAFGLIGFTMKQLKWPRPPLLLGFVLGALIERYMFISTSRFGWEWLSRPMVIILFAMALLLLVGPFRKQFKSYGGFGGFARSISGPKVAWSDLIYVSVIALSGYAMWTASSWPWDARIGPMAVGTATLFFCTIGLLNQVFSRAVVQHADYVPPASAGVYMDTAPETYGLTRPIIARRAIVFLAFILGLLAAIAVFGFLPAIPLFLVLYMRLEGKERWWVVIANATIVTAFVYVVFDQVMRMPWPPTLLGHWLPALQAIPSV